MNHSLENDELRIVVNELGAELQSITSIVSGEEYLWQGDPDVWSGRSPLLFPIVGSLKDSLLKHNADTYPLPRHGLARTAKFEKVKSDNHQIEFELRSNADTLAVFPWQFSLSVCYTLQDNRVAIEYRVQSHDDKLMRFAIGAHPAFRLPLGQTSIDGFAIAFNADTQLTRYPLEESGLLSSSGQNYPLNDQQIGLTNTLFNDDALVFKNITSSCLSLVHNDKDRLRVHTGGAPDLGIWAKPGAAFVCIEPWFGYADDTDASGQWADKPALLALNKDELFTHQWSIEIVAQ